ncbi:MAG: peptide chain release factor N(5)-glutamine methyltransferase [Verrucomicrobiota bacterium]
MGQSENSSGGFQPPKTSDGGSKPPLRQILTSATDRLKQHDIEAPDRLAEELIAWVMGWPRLETALHLDDTLDSVQQARFEEAITRLAGHEPLQYIIGHTEFMGFPFKTDRRALIPRPETEVLVETVLGVNALWEKKQPKVVDVGTGTGCIIISLSRLRPHGEYLGLDISSDALDLARENAALNGVESRIEWREGDLLSAMKMQSLDAIVANLPYIHEKEIENLPRDVWLFEPRTALIGEGQGLNFINRLIDQASAWLVSGGPLFLEIGEKQGCEVRDRMRRAGYEEIRTIRDLAQRERIIVGVQP